MPGILSPRQTAHARALAKISNEHGLWTKGLGAYGANYIEASENPYLKKGICCAVCVFYDDGHCDIVAGSIDPNALCKLWVIPQQRLG